MDFNLQQYLKDMRVEQKDDHNTLARVVAEGFAEIQKTVSGHETRIVVQENFASNAKWAAATLLTAIVIPALFYAFTH